MALNRKRRFKARILGTDFNDRIWGIHEWNLDIGNFNIYLTGEPTTYSDDEDVLRDEPGVEYQMSARLIKNLQILAEIDQARTVLIHMKTDGGDWNEGMAIYDAIKFTPNKVVILSYTHARSMSSIIFQAANKRLMMPHSYFLFHEGTLGVSGTHKSVVSFVEEVKTTNPIMLNIYIDRMKEKGKFRNWSRAKIYGMLQDMMDKKEEVYLNATTTVEWGLADGIFDGDWEGLRRFSG